MAIPEKDREFMDRVVAYYKTLRQNVASASEMGAATSNRKYKRKTDWNGEITETAKRFDLTRTKVTKILVTAGVYETLMTGEVQRLRNEGLSVKKIAEDLGVSVGTVSSNLPYTEEFHKSAEPSKHALELRKYRAYEKMQKERQVNFIGGKKNMLENETNKNDDWRKKLDSKLSFTKTYSRRPRLTWEMVEKSSERKKLMEAAGLGLPEDEDFREKLRAKEHLTPDEILELGEFPGALYDRNVRELEALYGDKLPFEPRKLMRLHMELLADFSAKELEIMRKYGKMEGDTISRDVLVSDDLPLYALHYVIQRVFGWQNSHLHRFYVNDDVVQKLTGNMETWREQVGVIYRSPFMDEDAEFWADDYNGGSFKNWLRKKYTGPCVSQCWAEGIISCRRDMENVDPNTEYYVEYGHYGEGKALPLRCRPVIGWDGRKNAPPKQDSFVKDYKLEVLKAKELPVGLLNTLFERGTFDLLERLPVGQVLAVHNMSCDDEFQGGEQIKTWQDMMDSGMDEAIKEIIDNEIDSPMKQPFVYSFTDELLYEYDFGDGWTIKITGSRNCADLVESKRITQDMLDKSNIKARVTYRPVLLARDGEMLIDDVGGPGGMVQFIEAINTLKRGEHDENGMSKSELKQWAASQGWHYGDSTDINLL